MSREKRRQSFYRREKRLDMDQGKRRRFLIQELLREDRRYQDMKIPAEEEEQAVSVAGRYYYIAL